ncbi:MAG TPA: hypothetical protein VFO20_04300 [Propionibacteriaceae bacterium]|nr:hypothetical protein [Propionibacteriaceae bacterium]
MPARTWRPDHEHPSLAPPMRHLTSALADIARTVLNRGGQFTRILRQPAVLGSEELARHLRSLRGTGQSRAGLPPH